MQYSKDEIDRVLVSNEQIQARLDELAERINQDYAGKELLLVCILKGAVTVFADVLRRITIPCQIDFMAISSYGSSTKSSGVVRILKDLSTKIEGRDIIIAEDILDSGLTLSYLVDMLRGRGPRSVKVCAFSLKDIPNHTPAIKPDYLGTHVPDEFIVGYGLDYAEHYRNLPYVGILKPEVYSR